MDGAHCDVGTSKKRWDTWKINVNHRKPNVPIKYLTPGYGAPRLSYPSNRTS